MYGLMATDSYKLFHKTAYDGDITHVYGNMTSRNGKLSNIKSTEKIVFVGLQAYILGYLIKELDETFFGVSKEEALDNIVEVFQANLGSYDAAHFEELWELGYLPISIKALPEGTLVPYGVPCLVFENTVEGFQWLPNFLETVMSSENWMIQTSATTSLAYYKTFKECFEKTGGPMDLIPFMGHDFSFRGMPNRQAAAMSGFGHLAVGFCGTDTLPALKFAKEFYGADLKQELVGVSVPATEHSTMTSSIIKKVEEQGISYKEAELETFRELMQKVPEGILSVVSDSFDFWAVVDDILPSLKEEITNRDGKLVIRPDSGDPVDVLCGKQNFNTYSDISEAIEWEIDIVDEEYNEQCGQGYMCDDRAERVVQVGDEFFKLTFAIDVVGQKQDRGDKLHWVDEVSHVKTEEYTPTSEDKGLVESLWDIFGGTLTDKGYKLLDEHIGAIYGDSITHERQKEICERLTEKGFCPTVVLGIGSYSFQYVTRDTHSSAVKATNITTSGGKDIAICKDPKTDSKKKSAKGLLRVEEENGTLVLYDNQTREEAEGGLLQEVFRDGKLVRITTLKEIRDRVQSQI